MAEHMQLGRRLDDLHQANARWLPRPERTLAYGVSGPAGIPANGPAATGRSAARVHTYGDYNGVARGTGDYQSDPAKREVDVVIASIYH